MFASEIGADEVPELMQKFIDANEADVVFEGRTLIADDLSERELKKLGISEYGKVLEDEDEDDDYEDVDEDEDEEEEKPKKKAKAKASDDEDEDDQEDW